MGFFTPTAWTKTRAPLDVVPACGRCGLYQKCKSPKMPHDGLGRRKTLIVAEGPGYNEDVQGKPLVGAAGDELLRMLWKFGVNLRADCWLHNAIICRATDEKGNNRRPTADEVRHCRANTINLIERLKPELIIPLGVAGVQSVLSYAWKDDMNEFDNMGKWAGWQIPLWKHNCWVCPTYHPSFVAQVKEKNAAAPMIVGRHLQRAFDLQVRGRPFQGPPPDYAKRVIVELDPAKAAVLIRKMTAAGRPMAFDYETDRLKPWHQDSKILCCSVSDGVTAVGYPWHGEAVAATKEFIRSDAPKIAANIQFEENWTWRHLKCGVRNWKWCTVNGAHWLNCHGGVCSLKFQAFVRLGAEDYDYYLEQLRSSGKGSDTNRLGEVGLVDLCKYCALDSLYEVLVADEQMQHLPVA